MKYHTVTIGQDTTAVRLERLIETESSREAAQRSLWLAESVGITANSVIVRPKTGEPGLGPMRIFGRDELRAPFFGAALTKHIAVVSERHIPSAEREGIASKVYSGDLQGFMADMTGSVSVAVWTGTDIMKIEDDLPVTSTLVQIAADEHIEWLIFSVDGERIPGAALYQE